MFCGCELGSTIYWRQNEKDENMVEIAELLIQGRLAEAKTIAKRNYPFEIRTISKRQIGKRKSLLIFIKDGFIDRYSGEKLFHPGYLRILNELLPYEFPFHPHGKTGECHDIYWDKLPSIDHLIPIYRGGKDYEENMVTTSMKRNLAKNNSLLEEIGWSLYPRGDFNEWDGCTTKFVQLVEKYSTGSKYIYDWYRVTKLALD